MHKKHLYLCSLLLFCLSCAQTAKKELATIREQVEKKEFVEAQKTLEKSSIKKDKNSRLLYEVYHAHLLYFQDKLEESARAFNKASKTVDKLYTKSIKAKLASGLINDTEDVYYGALYERSLIYYYQSLVNLKLAFKNPEDKKKYFDRARAVLIAWDSFDKDIKRSQDFKSIQSLDFFRQYFAAEVHEILGEKNDLEIALQLYKDAKENVDRVASAYHYFHDVEMQDLEQLQDKLNGKKVKIDFKTKQNKRYKDLIDNIDLRILKIAKKIRPSEYRKLKSRIDLKDDSLLESKQKIIFEYGLVNQLEAKDYAFNLNTAIDNMDDSASKTLLEGIGVPVITYFAMGTLGLGYVSQHGDVTVISEHSAGKEMVKELGVEFEIPSIAEPKYKTEPMLVVENSKGSVVHESKLSPIGLVNELAFINNKEFFDKNFQKRSARIGAKYLTAILAAYSTYKTMNESENTQAFAKAAAVGQFLISQKAIKETEKADIRHWGILPSNVYSANLNLTEGKYKLYILEQKTLERPESSQVKRYLGELTIKNQDRSLFTHRLF